LAVVVLAVAAGDRCGLAVAAVLEVIVPLFQANHLVVAQAQSQFLLPVYPQTIQLLLVLEALLSLEEEARKGIVEAILFLLRLPHLVVAVVAVAL
jgi:hypothetical protein